MKGFLLFSVRMLSSPFHLSKYFIDQITSSKFCSISVVLANLSTKTRIENWTSFGLAMVVKKCMFSDSLFEYTSPPHHVY